MAVRSDSVRRAARTGAFLVLLPAIALTGAFTDRAGAATPTTINLGTTSSMSVLAGAGVTNTGPSVLNRNLGTSPTFAVTGFPPGLVNGTRHQANETAALAQSDLTIAYNAARSAPSTSDVTGVDLSGKTLTQGVYTASTEMALSGPLPLTLNGGPDAVFIFQAGSTLVTAANSSVLLTGGAQACNVFWQVSTSATFGTDTAFVGSVLAHTSITMTTGADVDGRMLARTGAVTLDTNRFTNSPCVPTSGTPTTLASNVLTTPTTADPGTRVTVAATTPTSGAVSTATTSTTVRAATPVTAPGPSGSTVGATPPGGGGTTPPEGPSVPAISGPPRTGGAPARTSAVGTGLQLAMLGMIGAVSAFAAARRRVSPAQR